MIEMTLGYCNKNGNCDVIFYCLLITVVLIFDIKTNMAFAY